MKKTQDPHSTTGKDLSWEQFRKAISLKTVYVISVTALIGVVLILLDTLLFSPNSAWKGTLLTLGITLLTSSAISIFTEIFLRVDMVDFVAESLSKILSIGDYRLNNKYGIESFGINRSTIDFSSFWLNSKGYIKVIGFSALDILSIHLNDKLIGKLKSDPFFYIQILIINPWSTVAVQRSQDPAYQTKHDFFRKVWSVLLEMQNVAEELKSIGVDKSRFDVRLFEILPSVSMVIDRETALITPVISTRRGGVSPYFIAKKIQSDTCVFTEYEKHFDYVWKNSKSILGENLSATYVNTRQNDISISNELPDSLVSWISSKIVDEDV